MRPDSWRARLSPSTPSTPCRRGEACTRARGRSHLPSASGAERARERAAEKADAEFSNEFLNAARRCFEMIDDDQSGTLEKMLSALSVLQPVKSRRTEVGGRRRP